MASSAPSGVMARTETKPLAGCAARTYLPVSSTVAPSGCGAPVEARPTGANAPVRASMWNEVACPVASSTATRVCRSIDRTSDAGARPAETAPRRASAPVAVSRRNVAIEPPASPT